MRLLLTLIGLITFSSASHAAIFALETTASEPLYQTVLTKEIYQHSASERLKDLTITNANGEPVPYALVSYGKVYLETQVTEESKPLTIFPMQDNTLSQSATMNIELNNHDNQTSVNVTTKESNSTSKTYYLFDLGKKHPAFKKLTLDWQGQEGKLFTIDVLTSNNLKDWTTAGQAALLKVANDDQAILQNTITVDHLIKARYLKIQPQDAIDEFGLTAVNVNLSHHTDLALPLLWQDIPFSQRAQKDSAQTHIDFESTSRYPAEYLKVSLPQNNTITHATVLTRNSPNDAWRYMTKASLYRVNKNGKDYFNKNIRIPKTTARYWRLTFNQASGGIGKNNPQLSVGWLPGILVWNARGTSPFHLQIGEANHTANIVPIANLLKPSETKKVRQLPIANLRLVSNQQNLNKWDSPADYKRLWLWSGLFIGVFALGVMAYSLLKNSATNKPSK